MKKVIAFFVGVAIVLVVIYQALIFYDNNFRYGRMRETPGVKPHEDPLLIMEAGVVPITGGDAFLRVASVTDLKSPIEMDNEESIERGKSVYFTYCAQCHGTNYDGMGTVGQSFSPLPTDLRSSAVQNKLPGELFKTVSYGIPGGRQPALNTTITIEGRWQVVAFVRSLGARR